MWRSSRSRSPKRRDLYPVPHGGPQGEREGDAQAVFPRLACSIVATWSGDIRPLAAGPLDGVVDHWSERQASPFSISKRASNELIGTGEVCVSVSSCTKSQITYHFRIPETAQCQSCSPNPESSNYTAPCMNGWTFYCDMLQPSLITSTTSRFQDSAIHPFGSSLCISSPARKAGSMNCRTKRLPVGTKKTAQQWRTC